ncbi:coronatine-insensitive protein 1-like protein [Tanacetum coccineum]
MSRELFTSIVEEVTIHSEYFRVDIDCIGREDISSLMKCTFVIIQLAHRTVPGSLNEYLQMGETTFRESLDNSCKSEHLQKPTITVVQKLYAFHEHKIDVVRLSWTIRRRYRWVQGYRGSSNYGFDLLIMVRPFWNIEIIPSRRVLLGEDREIEHPAHILAYYSLAGPKTDFPPSVIPPNAVMVF